MRFCHRSDAAAGRSLTRAADLHRAYGRLETRHWSAEQVATTVERKLCEMHVLPPEECELLAAALEECDVTGEALLRLTAPFLRRACGFSNPQCAMVLDAVTRIIVEQVQRDARDCVVLVPLTANEGQLAAWNVSQTLHAQLSGLGAPYAPGTIDAVLFDTLCATLCGAFLWWHPPMDPPALYGVAMNDGQPKLPQLASRIVALRRGESAGGAAIDVVLEVLFSPPSVRPTAAHVPHVGDEIRIIAHNKEAVSLRFSIFYVADGMPAQLLCPRSAQLECDFDVLSWPFALLPAGRFFDSTHSQPQQPGFLPDVEYYSFLRTSDMQGRTERIVLLAADGYGRATWRCATFVTRPSSAHVRTA